MERQERQRQSEQNTGVQTPPSDIRAETISSARLDRPDQSSLRADPENARPKEPSLKVGERIGGCIITRFIAWGGMGEVYEGQHQTLERRVAIKLIRRQFADDAKYRTRFLREAKAAAQFTDSHIALVFDAGEERGQLYVTHEFIDGEDLAQRLHRLMMLPPTEALRIARDVALALTLSHSKGVIHRDIKPSNIMISSQGGNAKLMDFGLVRVMHGADFDHAEKETVVGTPQYMGPEQWQSSTVDARADLYSLGVTLYEMLSGALPIAGETLSEIYEQTVKCRLIPLRDRHPGLDPEIYALVDALLAPLDQRIQTAQETAGRIQAVLRKSDESRPFSNSSAAVAHSATPAPTPATPAIKPTRYVNSKWAAVILGAGLVAAAAAIAFTKPAQTESAVGIEWMLAGQHQLSNGTWESLNLLENKNLNSGDQFQIQVLPSQNCFLYVVMVTSENEPMLLYPATGAATAAAAKGNEAIALPGSDLWYKLDDHPGDEKIYVVASRKPVQSLSRILSLIPATRGASASPAPASEWKQALDKLNELSTTSPPLDRGIAGVTTGKPVAIKLSDGSNATVDLSAVSSETVLVKKVVLQHH